MAAHGNRNAWYQHIEDRHPVARHRELDEFWTQIEENPHCLEVKQNNPNMHYFINPKFDRILREDDCMMLYSRREEKIKTTIHWGQRKLLLSEIEFLTIIGPRDLRGSLVVYAGAAPGTHMMYLTSLFPEVEFLLYDPAPFNKQLPGYPMLHTKRQFFTNTRASKIGRRNQHRNVFFISDIRLANPKTMTEDEVEKAVELDMARQMEWHRLIGAKRSMLKFRLPWADGKTQYLAGDIYLPVWGPQTTTEARLITDPDHPHKIVTYNNKHYEMQMMFFNNVTRHSLFPHDVHGQGLDHCYDCAAEIHILKQYLLQRGGFHERRIPAEVSRMSREISREISRGRTLASPNPDPVARQEVIEHNQKAEKWVLDPESSDSEADSDREARAHDYAHAFAYDSDEFETEAPDADWDGRGNDRAFEQSSVSRIPQDESISSLLGTPCCQSCLSYFD